MNAFQALGEMTKEAGPAGKIIGNIASSVIKSPSNPLKSLRTLGQRFNKATTAMNNSPAIVNRPEAGKGFQFGLKDHNLISPGSGEDVGRLGGYLRDTSRLAREAVGAPKGSEARSTYADMLNYLRSAKVTAPYGEKAYRTANQAGVIAPM